jgi:hypothetical protein
MGVADKAGSIEVGKDANIVISEGDLLDMRTSKVTDAFIQGREVDLTDKHKLLNDRFNKKYNLKPQHRRKHSNKLIRRIKTVSLLARRFFYDLNWFCSLVDLIILVLMLLI